MSKVMPDVPNLLRIHRKRSPLTQADIAYFMGTSDYSNISRYEKGHRSPTIEFLLIYHHLFDSSIEMFFEHRSTKVRSQLLDQIKEYIASSAKGTPPKNEAKVEFLSQVIDRLAIQAPCPK